MNKIIKMKCVHKHELLTKDEKLSFEYRFNPHRSRKEENSGFVIITDESDLFKVGQDYSIAIVPCEKQDSPRPIAEVVCNPPKFIPKKVY